MGLNQPRSDRCWPFLRLRSRLRRRGKGVIQSVKRSALDIIDAVRDVAFSVGEKSWLVSLLAAEIADLLAADEKLGAVGKVTARHQRSNVAIEIAPLGRTNGHLIGLRCVFFSSVIHIMALPLDPLAGYESVVVVDTADVKRRIGLATGTRAALNRVVSGNKGRLCRLPGNRAWSWLIRGRGRIIPRLGVSGLDVAKTIGRRAARSNPPIQPSLDLALYRWIAGTARWIRLHGVGIRVWIRIRIRRIRIRRRAAARGGEHIKRRTLHGLAPAHRDMTRPVGDQFAGLVAVV